MEVDADLLVVGAGAKGSAVAAKAHILNSLGLGPIKLTVVDAVGPAAAWRDGDGVSSSREILALSPAKDVGFPYQSARAFAHAGAAIDRVALEFSWQRYLIEHGRYADWLDADMPPVQRRVYGAYLAWVLSRATDGVSFVRGRAARVTLAPEGDRWLVDIAGPPQPRRLSCGAFALTGQGVQRLLPHDVEVATRVLDCESGRTAIAHVAPESSSEIAIVGGGESALSCMEFVRGLRPDAQITVYTSSLPMSRVESFLENRVFSRPDEIDWGSLSAAARRDFIVRSDRGVFGAERLAPFAFDERCRFVGGRVTGVSAAREGRKARVAYVGTGGAAEEEHDYVINGTGYDLVEQLRMLLTPESQSRVEQASGPLWSRAEGDKEVSIGRALELEGMWPRLQVPGLAALSQGPGFSTLGALGLIADRMLEPCFWEKTGGDARSAVGAVGSSVRSVPGGSATPRVA
jgi:mycobactin lysine-N-oxygenase